MPKKIKIVYMGTPIFAILPLQALLKDKTFKIQAVITRQDKKIGRKHVLTPPPIKALALEYGLTVLQPQKIQDPKWLKLLQSLQPDLIIVVAYGKILPAKLLKIPKHGCINLHGSLLPKYRGASPIEEALLHGDTETGITFIKMNESLDSGDILLTQKIQIDPKDTALTLRQKLSLVGAAILPYLLKDVVEENIKPLPQNHPQASYCHKITKKDGLVKLKTMTATQIKNRLRAYTPWPSCFLMINNKRVKLLDIATDEKSSIQPQQALQQKDGSVALGSKKGAIILKKIQMEGKKPLTIQEFLRGNPDFFKNALASPK